MIPGLPTALRQLGADDVTIALATQGPTWQACWDAIDRPELLTWLVRKLVGEDAGWAAYRAAEKLVAPAREAFWAAVQRRDAKLKANEGWDEVSAARRALWAADGAGAAAIRALHPVAPALPMLALEKAEAPESAKENRPAPAQSDPRAPGPEGDRAAGAALAAEIAAAVTGTDPVESQRSPAHPNEPQPAPPEPEPPPEPDDPYHPAPAPVLPGQGSLF